MGGNGAVEEIGLLMRALHQSSFVTSASHLAIHLCVCVFLYICFYIYLYEYLFIYREREGKGDKER